ncbi:hypothetical protein GCM10023191_025040 [Actinoallomurus oryzae]|uniref:Uncharacterized protein n=1 Tax=Actinoallomurus oryzae TaxID=502180 RepID=A0ABP8PSE1_9ACTN
MAVHGGLRDLGQARAQIGGGAHPPAGQGVDDAHPYRMQQQIQGVHSSSIPIFGTIPKIGNGGRGTE